MAFAGRIFAIAIVTLSGAAADEGESAAETARTLGGPGVSLNVQAEVGGAMGASVDALPLFLTVAINGRDTGFVAEFFQSLETSEVFSQRSELMEVGLRPPASLGSQVKLGDIPTLTYIYNESAQSISITAADRYLMPQVTSATHRPEHVDPEPAYGAVLNYSLSTEMGPQGSNPMFRLNNSFASFDGWLFSPIANLNSTGFYRSTNGGEFIRQETALEFNNTRRALTLAVGDIQSSSLAWSRPIRMGGVQLRRDFSLRTDIVTEQLLSFSGAAAVPSTVDVFIENNRAFTGTVSPGPFRIEDVPLYTGTGDALVVIRDENGDETTKEVSFFASQNLIKKGTLDFSIEAGKAREDFGVQSDQYGDDTVSSASLRYGLNDQVTLEAHAEHKSDLWMYGLGVNTILFSAAEVGLTAGQSSYQGQTSGFVYGTLRTGLGPADLQMSVLRSESGFADLAYATGVDFLGAGTVAGTGSLLEFPTATETISLSLPVGGDNRSINFGLVRSERASSEDTIFSVSYGRPLRGTNSSISLFGSHNFETGNSRMALNLTMQFGNRTTGGVSASHDGTGQLSQSAYASRPVSDQVGDYGYHAQLDRRGGDLFASARVESRTRYGRAGLDVVSTNGDTYLRGRFDGSVVATGGRVALGNPISDSFAIVDVGAPNVPIYLQNREVTQSGRSGSALVTGLSSFRRNRISVDVDDFDTSVTLGATAMEVVPARRSGALVDFSGTSAPSVLVELTDAAGRPIPAGSTATLNGGKEKIAVGYDGMIWVKGAKAKNTLKVTSANGTCTASFAFRPTGEIQPVLNDVFCL